MQPKISIIVPIYNVEQYLEDCLESILSQTFTNFELILVNDGSTDNCGEICDNYEKKDSRVKVIHKENGGVSSARNMGIDAAKGKYIGFIDPDDTIERNMYELLLNSMTKYKADIVICPYKMINSIIGSTSVSSIWNQCNTPLSKKYIEAEIIPNILKTSKYYSLLSCCNKLYIREVFDNCRFDEAKNHGEDARLNLILLTQVNKLVFINQALYNYKIRNRTSLTQTYNVNLFKNLLDNKNFGLFLCNKYYPKGEGEIVNHFIISSLSHMEDVVNSGEQLKSKFKVLIEIMNDSDFIKYVREYKCPTAYLKLLKGISLIKNVKLFFTLVKLKGFMQTHGVFFKRRFEY